MKCSKSLVWGGRAIVESVNNTYLVLHIYSLRKPFRMSFTIIKEKQTAHLRGERRMKGDYVTPDLRYYWGREGESTIVHEGNK